MNQGSNLQEDLPSQERFPEPSILTIEQNKNMNSITTIDTEYLRSNRTIDTILLANGHVRKTLWIYNYEGVSFRVFYSLMGVFNFLNDLGDPENYFESEIELDSFLVGFRLE